MDLTFFSNETKTLNKSTKVSTEVNGKEVYFQLEEKIDILPATLDKIVVDERKSGIYDRSLSNLDEKRDLFFAPFGNEIQNGCALYLGFVFVDNEVPNTLDLMCYLYEKDLMEIKKYGIEQAYKIENTGLRWEISVKSSESLKNIEYEWKSILLKDKTNGFRKNGRIVFNKLKDWISCNPFPNLFTTKCFWLRCVVEDAQYEYPPRIESLRLNTVSAIHGMLIKNDNSEIVSNGLPGQVIELRETPVVDNTLKLSIEEERWTEVDDFEGSGPSDKHFVLNKEKGEIKFGDGLMGLVPSQGSIIRVLEYMTGGGEEGNLMSERSWKIYGFNDSIKNYLASTGGKEAQTIEEAIEDLCRDLKTPYTAVTLQDFEQLAVSTPGLRISRAKAIPNYDPDNPEPKNPLENIESVTVVIIPYTPLEILKTPPEPSEDFKKAVCIHLDKHRLTGTYIHVVSPIYVKVIVNARIIPMDAFRDDNQIREKVLEKLNRFLHPVKGGVDGKGWPIGRDIYLSEIYNLIENIEGVNCVTRLSISGDQNASTDADGNLILKPKIAKLASVYSGVHNVEIFREKDQCFKRGDSHTGK